MTIFYIGMNPQGGYPEVIYNETMKFECFRVKHLYYHSLKRNFFFVFIKEFLVHNGSRENEIIN